MERILGRRASGDGVIDAYLGQLRRALGRRFLLRGRLLEEAEAHLRESAQTLRKSGFSEGDAAREAIARFGPAEAVAGDAVRAAWPRSLAAPALLLLGTLFVYFLPLYAIPENTLPPAPWLERPDYLTWKLYGSLAAYGSALASTLLVVAAVWRGWARIALGGLLIALAAFGASVALGTVLAIQWTAAVPGSGTTLALTLVATAFTTLTASLAMTVAALHAPRRLQGGGSGGR